jgi:Holliday junction resolvase
MSAMQRNKGAAGERELFGILSDLLGTTVKRGLVAAREGGADTLDVPGWAIECKRVEKPAINAWWSQAADQAAQSGRKPVLFWRASRRPWLAFVDLHHINPSTYPEPGHHDPVQMTVAAWVQLAREEISK